MRLIPGLIEPRYLDEIGWFLYRQRSDPSRLREPTRQFRPNMSQQWNPANN
jgi:hypothetical protein